MSRAKIEEVTLNALRTRQSLVKGERLVRHEMRAVLKVKLAKRGASVVIHSLRGLEMHPTLSLNEQKFLNMGYPKLWENFGEHVEGGRLVAR